MYGLVLNKKAPGSQYRQLYEQLREKILKGEIPSGMKMASTRQISDDMMLARSVVLEVIDQLKVEGFLETRHGSGTFVKDDVTFKEKFNTAPPENLPHSEKRRPPKYSLIAGLPDLSLFPRRRWKGCYDQVVEYSNENSFSYCPAQEHIELREELSQYLYRTKGIKGDPENIIVTAGAAQALSVLAGLKPGGKLVTEDPCVSFIPEIFKERNFEILPVPVDETGIIPQELNYKNFDYIYLSPSHQFPLGGTLTVERRIELLRKAEAEGALILEDDYDSEFRYDSRPVAPIQAISPKDVVYIGTFSKNLSPALRLGYMLVPPGIREDVLKQKRKFDCLNEGLSQKAMALFIKEGFLERHLRKSRRIYKKRKVFLEDTIPKILGKECLLSGLTTGVHIVLQIPGCRFEKDFGIRAGEKGLLIQPVSQYCLESKDHYDKLIVGFGQIPLEKTEDALLTLKDLLSDE